MRVRIDGLALKKGDVITPDQRKMLADAGVRSVLAARLEDGDVGENEAAARIASRLAGPLVRSAPPFTGRVNLFAETAGLAVFDRAAIDRVNAVDEAITVATVPAHRAVEDGDMVATVKIIPFSTARRHALGGAGCAGIIPGGGGRAVPPAARRGRVYAAAGPEGERDRQDTAERSRRASRRPAPASSNTSPLRIRPERSRETLERLDPLADVLIVFGASAITDRRDVIPAAIEAIGGRIERFGMPVDPGNLLLLADRGGKPIIGAPGCARSPKENGFDWVLQRVLAGVSDNRRRHPRHGGRRFADGDRLATPAPRAP